MSEPIEGGCQCGTVRYRISGGRPPVYACHCRECQKQSASAFGISIPLARTRFAIAGETGAWQRPSESGATTNCHFCLQCGTRLYHSSNRNSDRITVKGGTLDDTSWLEPQAHLWVSRKQRWMVIAEDVLLHDTQPEDLSTWRDGLVGDWR
ncbi:MAG: GFA family protein [Sphingomonadaceae bacterium]|nr:GFA family protein [Sphingomonadaceae bacterium]